MKGAARHRAHWGIVIAVLASACHPSPPPPPISAPTIATPARPPIVGLAALLLDTERSDPTSNIAWSPDGKTFAVEEPGHRIGLWDMATGARRLSIETPGDVLALGFRRDGHAIWAATDRGAGAWDARPARRSTRPPSRARKRCYPLLVLSLPSGA